MTITLIGCKSFGNGGDGLRIEGDVQANVIGFEAFNNGGQGINIIKHAGLLEQLGLPKETDPKELAELLTLLTNSPQAERARIVQSSGLFKTLVGLGMEGVTLLANLSTIAASPQAQTIISNLMS
jgi:hypothetical protein